MVRHGGDPYVLKINPSMIPVMVAAVSREGSDVYALSDLVTDELTGKLEGVSGVASVTVSGALTRQAHVIWIRRRWRRCPPSWRTR